MIDCGSESGRSIFAQIGTVEPVGDLGKYDFIPTTQASNDMSFIDDPTQGPDNGLLATYVGLNSKIAVPVMTSTNPDIDNNPATVYPSDIQHGDGLVTLTVKLTSGAGGQHIRFVASDPPDESPYVRYKGGGDNLPLNQASLPDSRGAFLPATGYGEHTTIRADRSAVVLTDATGKAQINFRITNRYAGNNYVVSAYKKENVIICHTPPLVAWKRCYLELDQMYCRGSLRMPGDYPLYVVPSHPYEFGSEALCKFCPFHSWQIRMAIDKM